VKLFIDSANPEEVKKIAELGILDGVTTNPTLATLAGKDYKTAVDEILNTVNSDVSLEVYQQTPKACFGKQDFLVESIKML